VTVDTYEYGGGGPVYMVVGLGSGAAETLLSPVIIENRERSTLSLFALSKSRWLIDGSASLFHFVSERFYRRVLPSQVKLRVTSNTYRCLEADSTIAIPADDK
jgi:hypothetical protein